MAHGLILCKAVLGRSRTGHGRFGLLLEKGAITTASHHLTLGLMTIRIVKPDGETERVEQLFNPCNVEGMCGPGAEGTEAERV
jgi:hypothetical protein